jgi:hypothetical protein
VDTLSYIICAPSEIVIPEGSDTATITARDIFPDPSEGRTNVRRWAQGND